VASIPSPKTEIRSEAEIIRACQSGDREAFEALYLRYHRELFLYLLSVLRSPQSAEDVAQDVFVKLFHQIGSYRQQSPFNHWLFRMARNAGIDRLRREKVRRTTSLDAGEIDSYSLLERLDSGQATPEELQDTSRRAALVRQAVEALPQPFREIVALREWQDLPYDVIASRLGISEGTVKSRLFRARQMLGQRLKRLL
jgi:RNA polymerase sigma-70 factor (ECF subfamily)